METCAPATGFLWPAIALAALSARTRAIVAVSVLNNYAALQELKYDELRYFCQKFVLLLSRRIFSALYLHEEQTATCGEHTDGVNFGRCKAES